MRFRLVLPPLLVAAALAFAVAVPAPSSHPSEASRAAARRLAAGGDTVEASLDVSVGDAVKFNFHVTNASPKRIELRFPNGQTHDVVVLDAQGREVWRWSRGRMFTQAIQNRMLASSDTLTFSETWHPERPGNYTAVATLLSENFPIEERADFSLPGTTVSSR